MNYGDIRGILEALLTQLKQIARNTNENSCCTASTSAGTGSIPAGFGSVSIVQTGTGTVSITMSDGSIFTLGATGETYVVAAPLNKTLPAFAISGSSTWQWAGIK